MGFSHRSVRSLHMLVFVKVPSLSSNEGDNSFWSKTSSISLNFDAQEVTTKEGE